MIRDIYLALFLLVFSFGCVATEKLNDRFVGSVPKEIYQLMGEKKCSPIEGFYDRDIYFPAFVYVRGLFNGNTAIIFACEINAPIADGRYKVVLVRKSYSENGVVYSDFEDCKNEIYFRSMPGGLSVRVLQEPLSLDYNLWEHTRNYVWNQTLSHVDISDNVSWIIDERYEAVGYGLFCVEGDWYNVSYD